MNPPLLLLLLLLSAHHRQVIIITGSGDMAFAAGADIKEMSEMSSFEGHAFGRTGQRVMLFIEKMKKPVIAATADS